MAELTLDELNHSERLESSKNRARLLKAGKYAMRVGQVGSYLAGQHDLADEFREGAHGFKEAGEGHNGAGRKAASNLAGGQAAKFAQGKGLARKGLNKTKYGGKVGKMSGGRSAALGGAVSGALQGEGVKDIAKNAASWYFVYAAFAAFYASILTLVGWILPFLYLNFHFVASKMGSKLFGEMSLPQKLQLAAIDMLAVLLIVLLLVLFIGWPLYLICNPQGVLSLLEAYDFEEYIGVPKQVCDALNSPGNHVSGVVGSVSGIVETGVAAMCSTPKVLAQQNGTPYPAQNDPDLERLITCINSQALDTGQILSYDSQADICNYTRGNEICGECAYPADSCHYGGALGKTGSLAAEFAGNDKAVLEAALFCSQNLSLSLKRAACEDSQGQATACDSPVADHIYISLGKCDKDNGPINEE